MSSSAVAFCRPPRSADKKSQIERPACLPCCNWPILETSSENKPIRVNNKSWSSEREINEDREEISGHAVEGKTLFWLHRCQVTEPSTELYSKSQTRFREFDSTQPIIRLGTKCEHYSFFRRGRFRRRDRASEESAAGKIRDESILSQIWVSLSGCCGGAPTSQRSGRNKSRARLKGGPQVARRPGRMGKQ